MNKKIQLFIRVLVLFCGCLNAYSGTFQNGTAYQVCFTPGNNCISPIVNLINQAQKSIYMQAYSFDSYKVINALISAQKRGVSVNIILDKSNLDPKYNNTVRQLAAENIKLWVDTVDGIAHNKVIIVDDQIVETGSFNYTYTAQKYNAENVLIIHDANLAKDYMNNWLVRQKQSYSYHNQVG